MDSEISIIMPAYNLEEYIASSIMSVQQQTFTNWQLLVIDDGSTDMTSKIVSDVAEKDCRIQLLRQENGGSASARNAGLDIARGKYIAFLDGDDLWEPTFLDRLLAAVHEANVEMAYCGYSHLYTMGITTKFSYPYVSGDILAGVIRGSTQVHIGCLLVEKAVIERYAIRFTEGCLIGQDQEFIIKLVSVVKVQTVPKELMKYRIRMGSAINSEWNWKKHIHAIWGLKRAANAVAAQNSGAERASRLALLFEQRISYKVFKFIWRMIKKGYQADALQLLNKEFVHDISHIDVGALKLTDKMKYRIVHSKNLRLWKFISHLKFI